MSGSIPGTNNGKVGNAGANTVLKLNSVAQVTANGGGGGDGGHPSSEASPGVGGSLPSGYFDVLAGSNSSGMSGGLSGYNRTGVNYTYHPTPYTTGYGNGGNGTSGGGDPNPTQTGAGNTGYARLYFII